MSQALKDWIEQDREKVCGDYANGFLCYEEAVAKLQRLGFDKNEAHDFLEEFHEAIGSGSLK